jgi:deoxyribonuclease (pyrimidine dimer)
MTRINIIPPKELHDQHLVAEYRELFMVGSSLARSLVSPHWEKNKLKWPIEFTLNKGHVSFFYDKGEYLHLRYLSLIAEMKRRGMNPDPERVFKRHQWPDELFNDWVPSVEDQAIVRERIALRISQKPDWYRMTVVNDEDL